MVTTKACRSKLPSYRSIVSIDSVLFHSQERVNKWKYVVHRRIADELNIFYKHQSDTPMINLI